MHQPQYPLKRWTLLILAVVIRSVAPNAAASEPADTKRPARADALDDLAPVCVIDISDVRKFEAADVERISRSISHLRLSACRTVIVESVPRIDPAQPSDTDRATTESLSAWVAVARKDGLRVIFAPNDDDPAALPTITPHGIDDERPAAATPPAATPPAERAASEQAASEQAPLSPDGWLLPAGQAEAAAKALAGQGDVIVMARCGEDATDGAGCYQASPTAGDVDAWSRGAESFAALAMAWSQRPPAADRFVASSRAVLDARPEGEIELRRRQLAEALFLLAYQHPVIRPADPLTGCAPAPTTLAERGAFLRMLQDERRRHPSLASGEFKFLWHDKANQTFAFSRTLGSERSVVVVNYGPTRREVTVNAGWPRRPSAILTPQLEGNPKNQRFFFGGSRQSADTWGELKFWVNGGGLRIVVTGFPEPERNR